MKTLRITWTRLVKDGRTCERCGATQGNVARAVEMLEGALRPLGMRPVLDEQVIDEAAFRAAPSESNRILIAGRALEDWLGASVGASPCCSVCGELPCRTTELEGHAYEAIPAELIVRAALVAASGMIVPDATPSVAPNSALNTGQKGEASAGCCSPRCGCR